MSPPTTGLSRRTLILTAGASGIVAALGAPRPARAEPQAPAQEAAPEERPHLTLLGLI